MNVGTQVRILSEPPTRGNHMKDMTEAKEWLASIPDRKFDGKINDTTKAITEDQRETIITLIKVLLSAAQIPINDSNIAIGVEWMKDKSYEEINSAKTSDGHVKRKFIKELRKFVNKTRIEQETGFMNRVSAEILKYNKHTILDSVKDHLTKVAAQANATDSYGEQADSDIQDISKLLAGGVIFQSHRVPPCTTSLTTCTLAFCQKRI